MLGNVMGSNRAHIDHALGLIMQPGKRRIGMIGLSFKSGTDDLRESPLVAVAERLIGKGYDPQDIRSGGQPVAADRSQTSATSNTASRTSAASWSASARRRSLTRTSSSWACRAVEIVARVGKAVRSADQVVVDLVGLPGGSLPVSATWGVCW